MSPAVNVDLEEVPFAILEAVKARILANRRRLDQALTKPRVPTRPRPQFRKVGANSKSWRLPQHGAGVLGGIGGFVLAPDGPYVNGALTVTTDEYAPLLFSKFDSAATNEFAIPISNLTVVPGPVAGTFAVAPQIGFASLGYTYLSDFAGQTIVNLRKVSDPIDANNDFIEFAQGYPLSSLPPGFPVVTVPPLQNPDAATSVFDSFTLEFIHKTAETFTQVSIPNTIIGLGNNIATRQEMVLRATGVTSASIPGKPAVSTPGSYFGFIDLPDSPLDAWRHVAVVKDSAKISIYYAGILVFSAAIATDYWGQYVQCRRTVGEGAEDFLVNMAALPFIAKVFIFGSDQFAPTAIHGLRFTPSALYTTDTFTPPSTITELE